MRERVPDLSAAQSAWMLIELCRAGLRCRAVGRCVGELQHRDVVLRDGRLMRAPRSAFADRARHRVAARRHAAHGHDGGCVGLGVPLGTLERLLTVWAGAEAMQLLLEAVTQTIAELEAGMWPEACETEALEHAIGGRIAVRAPAYREGIGSEIFDL